MKTTQLFAAVAIVFAASGAAFAQEATVVPALSDTSTLTRSEVRADVLAARADGRLAALDSRLGLTGDTLSSLSRQAVVAQTKRALASGEIDLINAQAYDVAMARQIAASNMAAMGE